MNKTNEYCGLFDIEYCSNTGDVNIFAVIHGSPGVDVNIQMVIMIYLDNLVWNSYNY